MRPPPRPRAPTAGAPHPSVAARLARLSPDQRQAATAPPGPVLCVAPAGSGKTTTLVARIVWRIDQGTPPASICALTFNRRAADELQERLAGALVPLGIKADAVRVRTFHALGREILVDGGQPVEPLLDRAAVLEGLAGGPLPLATARRLDDAFSRYKLDRGLDRHAAEEDVAALPPGDRRRTELEAFVAYEAELERLRGLDFDDLVARALRGLLSDTALAARWQARCRVLFVDEAQDLDRAQLQMALSLASPANDLFLVGDDDQTIYAWRLADVRRILGLAAALPGLRRVDLVTNRRCPSAVVARAGRLVAHNAERFAKRIDAAPDAVGELVLRPDPRDDVGRARALLAEWATAVRTGGPGSHAVLARTNRELAPYAAAALELDLPYRAEMDGLEALDLSDEPVRSPRTATPAGAADRRAWAVGRAGGGALESAIDGAALRRTQLRTPDAPLVLATIHGTKGLEFDVVACVGLDEGVFPSARTLSEADDPRRALEEERRLAYVAWTRARRRLVLVYDPGAPSIFLAEAFDHDELARAWRGAGASREYRTPSEA